MSLIFGDNLRRNTAEHRDNEGTMPEFCRYQRPSMLCKVCQKTFAAYPGMRRTTASGTLAKCPQHQQEEDERRAARKQQELENANTLRQ